MDLARQQTWSWTLTADLSGTRVTASRPVAVFIRDLVVSQSGSQTYLHRQVQLVGEGRLASRALVPPVSKSDVDFRGRELKVVATQNDTRVRPSLLLTLMLLLGNLLIFWFSLHCFRSLSCSSSLPPLPRHRSHASASSGCSSSRLQLIFVVSRSCFLILLLFLALMLLLLPHLHVFFLLPSSSGFLLAPSVPPQASL